MGYVIVKTNGRFPDGRTTFVCKPGSENSFTADVGKAWRFAWRETAMKQKNGDESVSPIEEHLQPMEY